MSPRAASRLETLGFQEVYDYAAGKVDWLAHGLPREGTTADQPTAGDLVRRDAVQCRLDDPVQDAAQKMAASEYGFALVVNDDGVLLGRVRHSAIAGASGTVESQMEPGPSTIRPHVPVDEARQVMRDHDLKTMLVTTPEGHLLGVLRREDAEAAQH